MPAGERRYLYFLLRLWRVRQSGLDAWRASLEDPHTGKRRGFASLNELADYLQQQTRKGEDEDADPETRI